MAIPPAICDSACHSLRAVPEIQRVQTVGQRPRLDRRDLAGDIGGSRGKGLPRAQQVQQRRRDRLRRRKAGIHLGTERLQRGDIGGAEIFGHLGDRGSGEDAAAILLYPAFEDLRALPYRRFDRGRSRLERSDIGENGGREGRHPRFQRLDRSCGRADHAVQRCERRGGLLFLRLAGAGGRDLGDQGAQDAGARRKCLRSADIVSEQVRLDRVAQARRRLAARSRYRSQLQTSCLVFVMATDAGRLIDDSLKAWVDPHSGNSIDVLKL